MAISELTNLDHDLFSNRTRKLNCFKRICKEYYGIVRLYNDKTLYNFFKPEKEKENRYIDIPCWDHSRVVIQSDNDEDYIHANWIDGFEEKKKFIATQGPMENTVADFWKMVWQYNSHVIVMLTKIKVNNKEKCYQYWHPRENGELMTEDYKIKTLRVTSRPNYIRTFLSVTDKVSKRSHHVTHFQCTNWSEFGVPSDIAWFIYFIRMVSRVRMAYILLEPKEVLISPMVVHYSTGIGRTGTFCAVDIGLNQLVKTSKASIPEIVLNVRQQRYSGVMSLIQYLFTYKVLKHFLSVVQNKDDKSYNTCPICF